MHFNRYMYWKYSDLQDNCFVYAWFDKENTKNNTYIYVKSDCVNKIRNLIYNINVYEITPEEEDFVLLDDMKLKEKQIYFEKLSALGFEDGYKLYEIRNNTQEKPKKLNIPTEFRDYDNSDEYTTYIILRNDIFCSETMQKLYTSELTRSVAYELMQNRNKYSAEAIDSFFNGEGNTVILQASYEDLFVNNFIPVKYDNENIIFDYYIDNEEKVAQNNFRLIEGTTVGLVYFGKKSELPKFVKTLKLYK